MQLTPRQEEAVDLILHKKIGVITGAAGSGKTTVMDTALRRFKGTACLMAPTGRAAKRIQEVTGKPAATIHRALGAQRSGVWAFHRNNPLPFDLVIVDETSMVDVLLMQRLVDAIDVTTTCLMLVGDVNQLPSVGPGRVFADIIDSGSVPVVRLDVVQRAAASTWVYRAAPKVLEGGWEHAKQDQTYKAVWSSDPHEARDKIVDIVSVRMPRAGITDIQVMAPMYGGPLGVMALNSALQEALNPTRYIGGDPEPGLAFRSRGVEVLIRERDRVVQLTNDYTRAVFNGEIGIVKKITPELVVVEFDNMQVDYDHGTARTSLALAYALTVHRMQGSQTKWAVVAMSAEHARMWSRQILYTAITRAREGVCVVGDRSALQIALSSTYDSDRITFLRSRLSGEEEEDHDIRDDSGSEWTDS